MVKLIDTPEIIGQKALIYMRCSTDEDRQTVESQLDLCKKCAKSFEWSYEIQKEYGSAWNKQRPIFLKCLERIKNGEFLAFICFDMDRFSRDDPHIADKYLTEIVHTGKCRFISVNDSIDSDDDIKWNIVRHIMIWQANKYSERLSNRIKEGIKYHKKLVNKDERSDKHDKIVELWKKGMNITKIALMLNLPNKVIYNSLGYKHGRRRTADYKEILRHYLRGRSISSIARKMEINKSSVWHAVHRYKEKKALKLTLA